MPPMNVHQVRAPLPARSLPSRSGAALRRAGTCALLAAAAACAPGHPYASDDAHVLQTLIHTAVASREAPVCVSLATDGSETDPSPRLLGSLRRGGTRAIPLSGCPAGPGRPELVRLTRLEARGDTLFAEGERVAGGVTRYGCVVDRRLRVIQGDCAVVDPE